MAPEVWALLSVVLGSVVGPAVLLAFTRRKSAAEVRRTEVDTLGEVIERLREDSAQTRADLDQARSDLDQARRDLAEARRELAEARHELARISGQQPPTWRTHADLDQ